MSDRDDDRPFKERFDEEIAQIRILLARRAGGGDPPRVESARPNLTLIVGGATTSGDDVA